MTKFALIAAAAVALLATPAMSQPEYPVHCVRGSAGKIVCAQPPADNAPSAFAAWQDYVARANRKDAASSGVR